MKALQVIGLIVGIISGVFSIIGTVFGLMQSKGAEFYGFIGCLANSKSVWLPIASFAFGIAIGWFARGKRSGGETDSVPDSNPLGLSPLALDVYGKLDQPQIDAFKRLCSTCLVDYEGKEMEPLIIDPKADEMSIIGLNERDIEVLCDAGLAKKLEHYDRMHEVVPGYDTARKHLQTGRKPDPATSVYEFRSGRIRVACPVEQIPTKGVFSNDAYIKDMGVVAFTVQGREIARKLGVETCDRIEEYLAKSLQRRNRGWYEIKAK